MSLRIKLPALKPPLLPSPSRAVMENFQWNDRKRKRAKRYLSSDDELVPETDSVSVADYPRRQDSLAANSDIDVVGEEEHEEDDQRFNHTITNKLTKSKAMAAASHGPPARKKSRRVATYDPEADNEYLNVVGDSEHEYEDEDENDYFPTDPKPTTKGPKAKGKASATASVKGVAKRRAKVDNASEVPASSKKRPKLTPKADEVSHDVGDSSSTPNVSTAGDRSIHTISRHDSPPPPLPTPALPKKQKLPTIKKVKLPNHNNTSTSSSTVVVDTAAVLPVLPLGGKPIQDGVRKTLNGTIDIDLSNKSIYEEIFSKTGQGDGGTPRAGGNRRTKEEERRKELNRQRDEAKAKRVLEARQTFDLQAQFDRISRFEEKLKAVHSSALFPNFLAAKWRQEWEKEKRRQKGKDWDDSNYSQGNGCTTREEGEVR